MARPAEGATRAGMANARVRSYRDLEVWQRAITLSVACYRSTKPFPFEERFGLTAQIRRAAVSVAANVAEGYGRSHLNEYLRFLSVANGSLLELETHLLIAQQLDYLSPAACRALLVDSGTLGRMLAGLIRSLRRRRVRLQTG